jgi:hypothetical protein
MYDLYNKEDNQKIIKRIQKVSQNSVRQWGKMNAAEMLFHLQEPIRVSLGELKLKQALIGKLFGRMALKEVLSDKPFKKGVPTSNEFKPKSDYDLETEKEKLIKLVSSLAEKGPAAISSNPHPFFGKLSPEEWSIITWKHINHHLTQFGA